MEEKQAKVHNKSKYRRAGSSRGNSTEPASPSKTTKTAPPAVATPTTTPIVIVQSQPNDDEMAESPASSTNVNSKNVQSGVTNTGTASFVYVGCCNFLFATHFYSIHFSHSWHHFRYFCEFFSV